MIKNIIFDLGNVLLDFEPRQTLEKKGLTQIESDLVMKEIFGSDEWIELDRGTISRGEAIESIVSRNKGDEELLRANCTFETFLNPIISNTPLVKELNEKGFKTLYLTNYHADSFDYAKKSFDFFEYFDGGVVSAHVNLLKPDHDIYKNILEKYSLVPDQTLFIDDTEENTLSAAELGIRTIHLKNREELRQLVDTALLGNSLHL